MNTIYIYDVSAMINSGAHSDAGKQSGKPKREYNYNSYPTGGLYTFNQYFVSDVLSLKQGDFIIACFDGKFEKLQKRQKYPDYKANRILKVFEDEPTEKISVHSEEYAMAVAALEPDLRQKIVEKTAASYQLKLLRSLLPKMGVTVLYDETLEADDWIYTVAAAIGDSYNIVLRADDSDLDDCRYYAPNIRKFSVSGRKELTMLVGKNFRKIFHGETGDGIKNLCTKFGKRKPFTTLETDILKGLEDSSILFDTEKLQSVYNFSLAEVEGIQENNYLVTPLIQEDEFEVLEDPIDRSLVIDYLKAFKFKMALKRFGEVADPTDRSNAIFLKAIKDLPLFVKNYFKHIEYVGGSSSVASSSVQSYAQVEEVLGIH